MSQRKIKVSEEHGPFFFIIHTTYDYLIEKQVSPYLKAVYLAFKRFVNAEASCWPSLSTLEKQANVSRPVLMRSIHELVELKVLTVKSGKKAGEPNEYILHEFKEFKVEGSQNIDQGSSISLPGGSQNIAQGGSQNIAHEQDTLQQEGPNKSSETKVSGESKGIPPGHGDFMGAFKQGYTRFYGNSPSNKFVGKTGKQFVNAIYPEFGDMPEELFIKGIKMLWDRDEDQPIWCQQIIKRFRRNVGSLGMILRTLKEEAAERRTDAQIAEERGALKERARERARQVSNQYSLTFKIDDWVHEECSLELKRTYEGRLNDFLENVQWEQTEVDREARRMLKDWALQTARKRIAAERQRLETDKPVLWARLIMRDNATVAPENYQYVPSLQKASEILKAQEA